MKRAIARAIVDVRQALREPICVAGFPRSGTTWLSTTLAAAPGTRTYHEPFKPVLAVFDDAAPDVSSSFEPSTGDER